MINCKITRKDKDKTYFDLEIKGMSQDTLLELIRINCEFVQMFRDVGIPEVLIEKQLVNCVLGGFAMADHDK